MRSSKPLRWNVEQMETRNLLSTMVATPPLHAIAIVAKTPAPAPVSLIGTMNGGLSTHDGGQSFDFLGSGRVHGIETQTVVGNLKNPSAGGIAGKLVVSDSHGSMTLTVTPAVSTPGSNLPNKFTYTISAGTGSYSHATGQGTLGFVLNPGTDSPLTAGTHGTRATFSLTFAAGMGS